MKQYSVESHTAQRRQTLVNALASILQFVVIGLGLFFLYRFLLDQIGVEGLGLWSVVMSITTATSVANEEAAFVPPGG